MTHPGDRDDPDSRTPTGTLVPQVVRRAVGEFLRLESAGGIVLFVAAVLAMILANSPLSHVYGRLLELPISLRVLDLHFAKPLFLWINDGLMAVFFLLVGLEIKREFLDGELAEPSRILLPSAAAAGGMLVPALIYLWFNHGNEFALAGWAIPTATDIAFALGVLALLGNAVPIGLKLFLLTLAVLDDLGAVVVIAIFYSSDLSPAALVAALVLIACLALLNGRGVNATIPYLLVGGLLWIAVLKSGVHATLSGMVLAMFIPLNKEDDANSPLRRLEDGLHPWVAFLVLPVFAFANAGVSLAGLSPGVFLGSVPLGIALGLFLGKQLGIMATTWLIVKLRWARLPEHVDWLQLYGVALLCGIGFTMSLFIGSLAFEHGGQEYGTDVRLGILAGSTLCGVAGYLVLRYALRNKDVDGRQ